MLKSTLLSSTLGKLLVFIALLLIASTLGFYLLELDGLEGGDVFSALWWSVVTLTTVGYGDIVPHSTVGRVLGLLVMICGIGLVSTLTGNLASMLVEQKAKKRKGLLKVNLTGHVVILGWNSFAPHLVSILVKTGMLKDAGLVLVNSLGQEARDEIAFRLDLGDRLHFVWGDATQESVVDKAKPQTAKAVYILSQEGLEPKDADQQCIYSALTVRSLSPKVQLVGEVVLTENREHFQRAGVDEIIIRGEVASSIMGMIGTAPAMWNFLKDVMGIEGDSLLALHVLKPEEKKMKWAGFSREFRSKNHHLPLALCHVSKDLTLEDIMDQSSALDQYILELFASVGQKTGLGRQGQQVVVNPDDAVSLESYDAVLYLKPGGQSA